MSNEILVNTAILYTSFKLSLLLIFLFSILIHNGKKCVVDIREDATIAQYSSIISVLNADNYRTNSTYDFDFNIIKPK